MAVYDKNRKRIRELQLDLAKGKIMPEKAKDRIARIEAKGPEWWVKGRAYGEWFDHPVPSEFPGKKGAKDFDARTKIKVADRVFTPSQLLKIKLRDVFEAHRDAMAGRGGYKGAKTRCKHACRYFGMFRLDQLHDRPKEILTAGFERVPGPPIWKPKTRWQLRAFMRAAIGRYLRENPKILMNNPIDAFPMEAGTDNRTSFPTEEEHRTLIAHLRRNPYRIVSREGGLGPVRTGYPSYLIPLMVIKYEQGLRGMEIIPWRFERADLNCALGKFPAVETLILKKGGKKAWQWVVLTPESYDALRAYLDTVPGPKERGALWPVKNWPHALLRRALDECDMHHLVPHDWRRAWTMTHIDAPTSRRMAAVGRMTEESEEVYKHFNRSEQEVLYRSKWEQRAHEAQGDVGLHEGQLGE